MRRRRQQPGQDACICEVKRRKPKRNLRALGLEEGVDGVVRGRRAVAPHRVLLALAGQVGPVAVAAGGVRRRLHLIDRSIWGTRARTRSQLWPGVVRDSRGTEWMCRGAFKCVCLRQHVRSCKEPLRVLTDPRVWVLLDERRDSHKQP